jgi:hypothetical protein
MSYFCFSNFAFMKEDCSINVQMLDILTISTIIWLSLTQKGASLIPRLCTSAWIELRYRGKTWLPLSLLQI